MDVDGGHAVRELPVEGTYIAAPEATAQLQLQVSGVLMPKCISSGDRTSVVAPQHTSTTVTCACQVAGPNATTDVIGTFRVHPHHWLWSWATSITL